jgi:hypothetical protein
MIETFEYNHADIFLQSYNTYSNRVGNESALGGIIEVLKLSASINEIIKKSDYNLYDFFQEKFG